MPAQTEPRSGMHYGFTVGESGWGDDMDDNLLFLGRVGVHLRVLDRNLTAPPGSPSAGDAYIPAATATGAWAGWEGRVAVYSGSAWVSYVPKIGWIAYVEDEEVLSAFKSGGWSAGIAI